MRIYNSLTNRKEEFEPINPPKVNIYTCGVTVYDECHIGHARSLYIFDVIRRYLEYRGLEVNFVRNITDIDDKIINRSNELKIDWKELVDRYIDSYEKDLELLNIRKGILDKDGEEPRATKSIPDIIKYTASLIDKGYAYEVGSNIYFNVRKFSDYGKLSGQNIDQMKDNVRIEKDEKKQDPLDFVLWKASKEGEPSWDSPWGKGRPGWHIECSVMSQKFLKTDTLDIHGGGRDLIFPHHENEIAQSEAFTGKPFAKYWVHHGLLTINGQKMAKSLGNFKTVKEVLKDLPEHNASDILKDFFSRVHYSKPIDFSEESLKESKRTTLYLLESLNGDFEIKLSDEDKKKINSTHTEIVFQKSEFETAMSDDFNTPRARAAILGLVRYCNILLADYKKKKTSELQLAIQYARDTIRELGGILGLSLTEIDTHDRKWGSIAISNIVKDVIEQEKWIQDKIDERTRLRKEKKFAEADKIRKMLKEKGIALEDGAEGTTWRPC